jgi:hypothetical protein
VVAVAAGCVDGSGCKAGEGLATADAAHHLVAACAGGLGASGCASLPAHALMGWGACALLSVLMGAGGGMLGLGLRVVMHRRVHVLLSVGSSLKRAYVLPTFSHSRRCTVSGSAPG